VHLLRLGVGFLNYLIQFRTIFLVARACGGQLRLLADGLDLLGAISVSQ
jgi:hypothetical protein